jgi:hypothetical protein
MKQKINPAVFIVVIVVAAAVIVGFGYMKMANPYPPPPKLPEMSRGAQGPVAPPGGTTTNAPGTGSTPMTAPGMGGGSGTPMLGSPPGAPR